MDNGSQVGMTLRRMPQGGFLVIGEGDEYRGMMREFHFASTTIDEALRFMRDKLNPIPPQHQPGG
jgi:hypothetical protein